MNKANLQGKWECLTIWALVNIYWQTRIAQEFFSFINSFQVYFLTCAQAFLRNDFQPSHRILHLLFCMLHPPPHETKSGGRVSRPPHETKSGGRMSRCCSVSRFHLSLNPAQATWSAYLSGTGTKRISWLNYTARSNWKPMVIGMAYWDQSSTPI